MISYASLVLVFVALSVAALTAGAARAFVHRERAHHSALDDPASHTARGRAERLRHFLVTRFSLRTALGLQLLACVVICLAALALFGEISDNVIDRDELARFDGSIARLLAPYRTVPALQHANVVSHLGTIPVMASLAALIIATMFRREWRAVAIGWVLLAGGGEIVEQILKRTFRRDRPSNVEEWLVAGGYSFPSGHSMGAMVGYGLMTYLILLRVRRPMPRIAVIVCAAAIVFAIGFSRLLLGVHYFTDVIGGYAAGLVWISLAIATVELERSRWHDRHTADRGSGKWVVGSRQ